MERQLEKNSVKAEEEQMIILKINLRKSRKRGDG